MDIITIDFETYYDQEYSLSKMTTEAYVRDDRFEIIGVGVKINSEPTDTYSGEDVGRFLRSLNYKNAAILAHNTVFDGAILRWRYGIKPKFWLDTLSMSRPEYKMRVGGSLASLAWALNLGEKGTEVVQAKGKRRADFTPQELDAYMGYCANDVELTYKLYQVLKSKLPPSELLMIDLLIRMYVDPLIEVDVDHLRGHLHRVMTNKEQLLNKLSKNDPERIRKILSSNDKFADLLRLLKVTPPTKISKTTGKTTYAFAKTDRELLDLQDHSDQRVQAVVAARLGVKSTIEETRTQSLIEAGQRGRLPVMLNYHGAHTGRLSGGDGLNLQNLPSRGGKAIREAICAPDGHVLMVGDLSQIEARLSAYLAGEDRLVEAFRQGRDVYSEFASNVYGRTITKADKRERFVGKTCILGLQYGMGSARLKETLALGQGGMTVDIDIEEALRIVKTYRDTYMNIAKLWRICDHVLKKMTLGEYGDFAKVLKYNSTGIQMTNGMYITYPALRSTDNSFYYVNNPRDYRKLVKSRLVGNTDDVKFKSIWGGSVVENFTQGQAGVLMKEMMVKLHRKYPCVLQVHDELISVVPEDEIDYAEAYMRKIMSTPPKWAPDLPVACEVGYHKRYGKVVKT